MVQVSAANLADDDVRSLITLHQRRMYDASPPGTSFALDLSGLEDAAVIVLEARDAGALLGVGALLELSATEGEIKSMRTADTALRRGVGQSLLDRIIAIARERGYRRVLLETGTGEKLSTGSSNANWLGSLVIRAMFASSRSESVRMPASSAPTNMP